MKFLINFLSIILFLFSCSSNNPLSPKNNIDINGKVVNSDGQGLPNIIVSLKGISLSFTDTTNQQGIYTFINIPNGVYSITPQSDKFSFSPNILNCSIKNNFQQLESITAFRLYRVYYSYFYVVTGPITGNATSLKFNATYFTPVNIVNTQSSLVRNQLSFNPWTSPIYIFKEGVFIEFQIERLNNFAYHGTRLAIFVDNKAWKYIDIKSGEIVVTLSGTLPSELN